MQIVTRYGTMWARNTENIKKIPEHRERGVGVYILFDGSMPVYVGKGNIRQRIVNAQRSNRRKQLWDRFSWYTVADPRMLHDIEVLLLRALPPYLRALTRQDGHFLGVKHSEPESKNHKADPITRHWKYRKK